MVVGGVLFSFLVLSSYYLLRYGGSNLSFTFFYVSGIPGTGLQETTLLKLLLPVLAVSVALTTAFTLALGLLYSHRIAGPIYNLKRVLRDVRRGNLDRKVRFRKKDEFHDLAAEVTRTITWVRNNMRLRRRS